MRVMCISHSSKLAVWFSAQIVDNPPTVQETWVQSLGQEDPLEKGLQPAPVFLPGKSCGQRSREGYSPWGRKE